MRDISKDETGRQRSAPSGIVGLPGELPARGGGRVARFSGRYRFENFVLDGAAYTLRRSGAPVRVRPQVIEVLIYLIENRDRVVPREELFHAIWHDTIVSAGSLTAAVSTARAVLGDKGSRQQIIATCYGRGYRFVAPVVELRVSDALSL